MTNQQCGEMREGGEVEDLNTSFTTIVAGKCVEVSFLCVASCKLHSVAMCFFILLTK